MTTTIKTLLGSIKEMPNHDRGICGQPAMMSLRLGAYNIVRDLMVKWPKYSGSYDYRRQNTVPMLPRQTQRFVEWLLEQPELDVQLYRMQLAGGDIFNIKD